MYNVPMLNMSAHNVGVSHAMNVKRYRRIWLMSTCAYSCMWKGNMRLINDMRLYT